VLIALFAVVLLIESSIADARAYTNHSQLLIALFAVVLPIESSIADARAYTNHSQNIVF
jgi:hypothetical protein